MFKGVMGPSFATTPDAIDGPTRPAWAYRRADTIDVDIQTQSDTEAGHYGASFPDPPDTGWTRLYRRGHLIGETSHGGVGTFTVPAQASNYRLDVTANADGPGWGVSTSVRSTWKFRSTNTGEVDVLPLMSVRYTPRLNRLNQGPAGKPFSFSVSVEHQPDSTSARVTSLTLRASFDDGRHWKLVKIDAADGHWTAHLRNPTAGHVSLQATAKDADSNTVTQTILRAYTVG